MLSLLSGAAFAPRLTLAGCLALLALPFFCVSLLRALALWHRATDRESGANVAARIRLGNPELPHYSVLVPLFREAGVVPGLIEALAAIDYPPGKLEILFVLESIDLETRDVLDSLGLPPHMRTVVVPDGEPRTKPRALNYALQEARGELIVVYDAEDIPDRDQLRLAAGQLAQSEGRAGCVQARLNIYNSEDGWLTRQFTIEYSALFDCLLPALERLRLPVPLGGTSNHFRRAVLDEVGAWDDFNVTEDADLGIRLARAGWRVEVLASTTLEEAPRTFRVWRGQRTRWLKGWMQTYLVHMRQPARLFRELGPRGFFGFQVLMGGLILSALVHPWFYVLAAADAWSGWTLLAPETAATRALWWIGAANLVAGYVTAMALGAVAAIGRARYELALRVIAMPVYWLLISLAAYRALWQLARAPYLWEKTEHSARRPRDEPSVGEPATQQRPAAEPISDVA